jgi:hypothetical protein
VQVARVVSVVSAALVARVAWVAWVAWAVLVVSAAWVVEATGRTTRSIGEAPRMQIGERRVGLGGTRGVIRYRNVKLAPDNK